MRILMVAKGIARAGGAEEYLSDVTTGLSLQGHTVSILYGAPLGGGDSIVDNVEKISVLVRDFNHDNFVRELIKFNPDVVNFQNVINSSLLRSVSKLKPTTVFIHNHESYCPGNSKYFFNGDKICTIPVSSTCAVNAYLKRCMTRRPYKAILDIRRSFGDLNVLRSLKTVICNSRYVKGNLVLNGLKEESVFVNHLFPTSEHGTVISGNTAKGPIPTVIFVGRLFKEKGVDHLLKALSLLKRDFRAVIVGDGWERASLERLSSALGIGDKVNFKGFCGRSEVANLYRKSYLLAVPSLWPEGFGLVGLEAMSYRLPVVAYNSGGIPEWLKDGRNGYIVERGNIEALASKIDTLLGDPSLALKFGTVGNKMACDDFGLERHLVELVSIYKDCIKGCLND